MSARTAIGARGLAAAIAGAVGMGAAILAAPGTQAAGTTVTITKSTLAYLSCRASLYCFDPQTASGTSGSPITWINPTTAPHSVTGEGFDLTLGGGESASWTFPAAGSYQYHCRYWPEMVGTVVVSAVASAGRAAPARTIAGRAAAAPTAAATRIVTPNETSAPASSSPGAVATVLLPDAEPGPAAVEPPPFARGADEPPTPPASRGGAPRSLSTAASHRPAALYAVGASLFAAILLMAAARQTLRWWRRASRDAIPDGRMAGLV